MELSEAKNILSRLFFDDREWAVACDEHCCESGEDVARDVEDAIDTVLKALEEYEDYIDTEIH